MRKKQQITITPTNSFFRCDYLKKMAKIRLNFEERQFIVMCDWKIENVSKVQRRFRMERDAPRDSQ